MTSGAATSALMVSRPSDGGQSMKTQSKSRLSRWAKAVRNRFSRATMLTSSISAPARSIVAGMQNSRSLCGLCRRASWTETSPNNTSYDDGVPDFRSVMPSAVLALPWGSRSMTRVLRPWSARAAARLTAVVVLPTPPFWFATVKTRRRAGRRSGGYVVCRTRIARSAAAPIGVSYSALVSRETFGCAAGAAAGSAGGAGVGAACGAASAGCAVTGLSSGKVIAFGPSRSVPTCGAAAARVALKLRLRGDANSSRHMSPP